MKKLLGLLIGILMIGSGAYASNLSFSPEQASFGRGCDVYVDIIADSKEPIVASDILIETSLEYKDFIPADYFPYFFPPKVRDDGLLHIIGFSTYYTVQGKGRIGTLVLRSKDTDSDGILRFFFVGKGKGNTIDSNLSRAGGTDTLGSVGHAYYTFTNKSCEDVSLSGGFGTMNVNDALQALIQKIDQDGEINTGAVFHRAAPVQTPVVVAQPSLWNTLLSADILIYKFVLLVVLFVIIFVFTLRLLRRKHIEDILPPNPPAVGV